MTKVLAALFLGAALLTTAVGCGGGSATRTGTTATTR